MRESKQLKKRLKFRDYPADWRLLKVAIDWSGEPLVLFEEGRPPQPPRDGRMEDLMAWMNHPPKAYNLIHWSGGTALHTRFDNEARSILTSHIQPFGNGWLLGDGRGGLARMFDSKGEKLVRTLDLGDASEDIQTTPEGHIWVGYFDEGVFGDGIGAYGLVCLNADGAPVFKYADFADEHELPHIDDCYALNVCRDAVWVCYYSAFPLVCLENFQLARVWEEFGSAKAVAVREKHLVRFPAYRKPFLLAREFDDSTETTWDLADADGTPLVDPEEREREQELGYRVPFSVVARGSRIYVNTETTLFEAP
jgi:hypothetical protein